jgi:hypothetical protein
MSADGLRVGLEQVIEECERQAAFLDKYRFMPEGGTVWAEIHRESAARISNLLSRVAALLHAHPPAPDLLAQIRALPRNAHTITRNDGLTWKIEYVAWADLAALLPVPPSEPTE